MSQNLAWGRHSVRGARMAIRAPRTEWRPHARFCDMLIKRHRYLSLCHAYIIYFHIIPGSRMRNVFASLCVCGIIWSHLVPFGAAGGTKWDQMGPDDTTNAKGGENIPHAGSWYYMKINDVSMTQR